MTAITLPPLPKPESLNCEGWPTLYSRSELRARDLAVAALVLAAAADRITGRGHNSYEFAQAIRAMEVSHAE